MDKVFQDALRATFQFIGQTIMFAIGILGCIAVTALSLSGEVIDELTTYNAMESFPWAHVFKVMVPPCSLSILAYIQHRKMMADALNTTSLPDRRATIASQKAPEKAEIGDK